MCVCESGVGRDYIKEMTGCDKVETKVEIIIAVQSYKRSGHNSVSCLAHVCVHVRTFMVSGLRAVSLNVLCTGG